MEEFFRSRGAKAIIDLCPLADFSLIELVNARGYRLTEFNNVLARAIAAECYPVGPRRRLRDAQSAGCDLAWAAVLPGSVSERNYARCGFRAVYTRAMMVREF